ncbi:Predicted lipoprotein [Devosia crocina]|uniref:Predicted lipoprotein n=1 Tax=Devosia crocina TaxID=429728 RepID=A0A1I7NRS6_9HYPH|nr:DUF2291 domain-containing protein [Devosia crocina]SFV37353.1 Predicted lipoprotein [Devosia crocina]
MDRRIAWIVLALALPLSGCKIVQIADQEANAPAGFDAAAYADGIWTDEVLPYFSEAARPVDEVVPAITGDFAGAAETYGYRPGEGSPWSFVVSGTGRVLAKNTESRAGTMDVAVEGVEEPVVVQIGPVIRGNGVRDALPFVAFKDFTNQLEYANAGKALTALALDNFATNAEAVAVGDTVTFSGAITMTSASDRILVTPISLEKAGS